MQISRYSIGYLISAAVLISAPADVEAARAPIKARKSVAAPSVPSPQIAYALEKQASGDIKDFYAQRRFRPLWLTGGSNGPAIAPLLSMLSRPTLDGLDPDDHDFDDVKAALAQARSGRSDHIAEADIALSKAFARYAADMKRVRDPSLDYVEKQLKPKKPDPDFLLNAAGIAPNLAAYVKELSWMSPHYRQQRSLLARAQQTKSSAETIRRLRLNLERARELPSAWTRHVVVDASSGQLWQYSAGRMEGTMRVVVGKAATPTPMMAGMLRYAIQNPYWNIPLDLAQDDIAKKVLAGKSLASMRMEALSDWGRTPEKLEPASIDWPAVRAGKVDLRLRQLPGPSNSMGRIKFMFPNDMGIFLHDTPERALLGASARHFSNGCVRLGSADQFALWLMQRPIVTNASRPDEMVPLATPVPVYLTYFTSRASKNGITFAHDVYGRDGA